MTGAAISPRLGRPAADSGEPQRFVFRGPDVDWAFYQGVRRRAGRRAFVTYYKGRREVVTVSYLHERMNGILVMLVRELAVAAGRPICGAGAAPLDREDLDEGTQPDASFYVDRAAQMVGKTRIDLASDPPPDLAIKVEVTHRLDERRHIYQEIGVPELWVAAVGGLSILLRQQDGTYAGVDRSPTFPLLSAAEMRQFVTAAISLDDTAILIAVRARVRMATGDGVRS